MQLQNTFLVHILLLFSYTQTSEHSSNKMKQIYTTTITYPCESKLRTIFQEIGRDDLNIQEQNELNAFITNHACTTVTLAEVLTLPPMRFLDKGGGIAYGGSHEMFVAKWAQYARAILPKELHPIIIQYGIGSIDIQ